MSTPQWSMAKTPKNSYQTLNIDDCFCCNAKEKKRSHAIRLYRSVWHFLPDFFFFFLPTLLLLPSQKNSLTHQSIFFPKSNLWKIEEEKGAWSKNQKMNWLIFLDDFLQLAWMLSDPSHNQNGCFNTRCLKITEKVSFKIANEDAKNGQFDEFLNYNWTSKNPKATFWVIFKNGEWVLNSRLGQKSDDICDGLNNGQKAKKWMRSKP